MEMMHAHILIVWNRHTQREMIHKYLKSENIGVGVLHLSEDLSHRLKNTKAYRKHFKQCIEVIYRV